MTWAWNTETVAALLRLAATLIASIAAGLGLALDTDSIVTVLCCAVAVICFVYSWWRNNNVTYAAQTAQEYLDQLKEEAL